ncbi:MAG TPA: hypothetical protein VM283_02095, partial [Armatimonadota bacterium]|nr:hypothetical protein [Armatimonadota bacterium]
MATLRGSSRAIHAALLALAAVSLCVAWPAQAFDAARETRGLGPGPDAAPVAEGVPVPPEPVVVAEESIAGALDVTRWRTSGPMELSASEMKAPGTDARALRVQVALSYEDRAKQSYTAELLDFEQPQDWSSWNRLVLPVYVEPSVTPRGGSISVLLYVQDLPRQVLGPYVVPRGGWHEVVWDLTPVPRAAVKTVMVVEGLHAHNP